MWLQAGKSVHMYVNWVTKVKNLLNGKIFNFFVYKNRAFVDNL